VSSSADAGCYLCNYLYYRALRRLPGKRVGFVHVPPLDVLPFEDQRRVLAGLIDRIEGRG
jgi:pyrrolidone-carboxylate peptidase